MFSISATPYSQITKTFFFNRKISSTGKQGQGPSGKIVKKDTKIPRTKELHVKGREFVRAERAAKRTVTARQIVDYFVKETVLHIPKENETWPGSKLPLGFLPSREEGP